MLNPGAWFQCLPEALSYRFCRFSWLCALSNLEQAKQCCPAFSFISCSVVLFCFSWFACGGPQRSRRQTQRPEEQEGRLDEKAAQVVWPVLDMDLVCQMAPATTLYSCRLNFLFGADKPEETAFRIAWASHFCMPPKRMNFANTVSFA